MKTIAYQGILASFSYLVAKEYFGINNSFIGTKKFADIFKLVISNKVQYGIIPIENSLAGSIYECYDLLAKHHVWVIGQTYLKVQHCLLGLSKDTKISRIFSHYKALEQCAKFFEKHREIEAVVYSDTAGAAKYIVEQNNKKWAAIASQEAAQKYGLKIIKKNIEDNKKNYTRFLIIGKQVQMPAKSNKCSLIFTLPHVPGSLQNILGDFANNKFNLTKIESRPIYGRPFEYIFYADFEYGVNDLLKAKQTIFKLKKKTIMIKVLGFYPSKKIWKIK